MSFFRMGSVADTGHRAAPKPAAATAPKTSGGNGHAGAEHHDTKAAHIPHLKSARAKAAPAHVAAKHEGGNGQGNGQWKEF